ncbi:unnamed protein product [Mytilus coruscus]|uniref:Uncharacterized protein n=1 Tax=Mytilus coruscus TaxID=42192 RepID=A0A6J8D2V1_MYTCO|nr:unnamed protein product [Mytilus coruscus]
MIKLAYPDSSLENIKAHSTRAIGPSWALYKGASINSILEAADWSSESTFGKFYLKDLHLYIWYNLDDRNLYSIVSSSVRGLLWNLSKSMFLTVTSWLDDDKEETTIASCLQLLSGAMSYHPARVVNLMVNSYKFIALINSLITSGVVQLQNASWNILSLIILNTKGLNEKAIMTVDLTINPVGEYIQNINTITPYLQVLSALFQVDFTCPLVSLKNTGRYPPHMACPFTTKDFKVLFIYLQQLVLQDVNDVKSTAVQCIEDMFRYLKKHSYKLVSDLLKCSWNSILMEVLITITASDLSSLQTTLQFIDVVLELDQNETIFKKNSNLHQHLVDFIKCIDMEDVTNHATLSRIRNKIL